MNRVVVVIGTAAVLAAPPHLSAQGVRLERVTAPVLFESYSFDPGLIFNKVSEITVPVGIDLSLGRFGNLTISSGFAKIDLTSSDPGQLPNQSLSGILNTEVRLGVNVIPGSLVAFVTGALPTGIKSVARNELAILGAISSDIIGFAAPRIGSGGSVGGGFAGAVPVGAFALGIGANYKLPLSYQPVLSNADQLKPGAEFRFRAGFEGPVSRQTYIRIAGIYALRSKDQVASIVQNGVGDRLIGYVALSQALGNTQLSLYGFDIYRGGPRLEATAQGLAELQKGNLFAIGARWGIPFGRSTRLTPLAEYRVSAAAPDGSSPTERQGTALRYGVDFSQVLSPNFTVIVQGSGVSGDVQQGGVSIGFNGYRAALHLQVTP